MKSYIKSFLSVSLVALAILFQGCKDESYPTPEPLGPDEAQIDLSGLTLDVKVVEVSRADADAPDPADFDIKIISGLTGATMYSWKYSSMPEIVTLVAGTYRVEAVYGENVKADKNKPYYVGSQEVTLKAGDLTKIEQLSCKLANIKVTIDFTDRLREILDENAIVTVVANDGGTLTFTKNETDAGYFQALEESRTLIATLRYDLQGEEQVKIVTLTDVQAGQHRRIVYDYKSSDPSEDVDPETGTASRGEINIDVTIIEQDVDGTIITREDVLDSSDRPGHEDPITPPDNPDDPNKPGEKDPIEITSGAEGLDIDNEIPIVDGQRYIINIHSEKGLTNLKVEINSPVLGADMLQSVGLTDKFDLAEPGDLKDALAGLGFAVGDEVIGQNDVVFNITQFIPLIAALENNQTDAKHEHKFTLTAIDSEGNTEVKTLTFVTFRKS